MSTMEASIPIKLEPVENLRSGMFVVSDGTCREIWSVIFDRQFARIRYVDGSTHSVSRTRSLEVQSAGYEF